MLTTYKPFLLTPVLKCCELHLKQTRNIQVSIVGVKNSVGKKVALNMKRNSRITKLKLYDFDPKVQTIVTDLDQLPGGPSVQGFSGGDIISAITMSNLILAVSGSIYTGRLDTENTYSNSVIIKHICEAMAERNPDAMLGISTTPINTMVPYACCLLNQFNCFNPFKVFGMSNIDVARAETFAARALNTNPRHLTIPVIGGRSVDSVLPLFSNLSPHFYKLDEEQAEKLTRLVRKADDMFDYRGVITPVSSALAWSISDTANKVIDALCGCETETHCFSANPNFGTRFFAGPVNMGPNGITRAFNNFPMSPLECSVLSDSIEAINRDVAFAEKLATTT